MHDQVLMARQPIYDQRINIVAYELLFRQIGKDTADVTDGDAATSEILIDAFTQWDIREIVGNTRAFVNFTKSLISEPPPFDKDLLVIELLEDVPIDDEVVTNLKQLSERGYTIALDDFGTGYSSLSYLTQINIDTLKVDRQFVTEIQTSERSRLVTGAIIDLAKRLSLSVCAEGIENHEQWDYLKLHGCDSVQGFMFSKPVPLSELLESPSQYTSAELHV